MKFSYKTKEISFDFELCSAEFRALLAFIEKHPELLQEPETESQGDFHEE